MEEPPIEVIENFLEMVMVPSSRMNMLASPDLADDSSFGGNIVTRNVAAITCALRAINGLPIQLGKQNVRDRMQHGFGSAFQQVRNSYVQLPLPQADGVVDGDEGIEPGINDRRGSARTKIPISCLEYFGKLWRHLGGRVAQLSVRKAILLFLLVLHIILDLDERFAAIFRTGVDRVQSIGQQKFVLAGFFRIRIRRTL